MKIKPVRCVALIKPDKVEDQTEGGIYYPDVAKDRMQSAVQEGTIIAFGDGFFDRLQGPVPKVGDKVIYDRYAGATLTVKEDDGKRVEYRLCNDNQIVAIVEE